MSDFVNDRLLNSKRFSFGKGKSATPPADDESLKEDQSAPNSTASDAETMENVEQRAAAGRAVRSTTEELQRQRREMLVRLEEHVHELEHEQDRVATHVETVQRLRTTLEQTAEIIAADDPAALRELRRAVEGARLELARQTRREINQPHSAPSPTILGANPTFGRLLRAGLAFHLPLIVAVLLAAGLLTYALTAAFGL